MAERMLKCPNCQAPLAPSRLARQTVCNFCGATVLIDEAAVPTARFREALAQWNSPERSGFAQWWTVGGAHWAPIEQVGRGDISDVYRAQRARFPSETTLLKVVRDEADAKVLLREWTTLQALQTSPTSGAETLSLRIPSPIVQGRVTSGAHEGAQAAVYRWPLGFEHSFVQVHAAYPQGIAPVSGVWVWRRLLEVLSFLHRSGFVHGAVLPEHALVERNDHGVWLTGYGAAGFAGTLLPQRASGSEAFYPSGKVTLTPALDVQMSARTLALLLGGEPRTGQTPPCVPPLFATLLREIATGAPEETPDAWMLRERVGRVGRESFGAPSFHPISMPDGP